MVHQGEVVPFFRENFSLFLPLIILRIEFDHIRPVIIGKSLKSLSSNVVFQIHACHSNNGKPKIVVAGLVKFSNKSVEAIWSGSTEESFAIIAEYFFLEYFLMFLEFLAQLNVGFAFWWAFLKILLIFIILFVFNFFKVVFI